MKTEVLQRDSVREPPLAVGNFHVARILSIVVAILAVLACTVGMLSPSVYRDRTWLATAFGNDLITLVLAVPTLVGALTYSARGSIRGTLLWLGSPYYMLYNYAFYLFGVPVSKLFLVFVGVFTFSALALVLGLANLDVETLTRQFRARTPARSVAAYMFF